MKKTLMTRRLANTHKVFENFYIRNIILKRPNSIINPPEI